ncbi:hypothetical protein BT67DRAFT_443833 [Trichocladium antarcticum]|uniref:Uncharacterized protein n=1 Tax=Trichocladium antarcticum TaxID=1450529 RepID=A0AAN6UFX8_9PEZI|nr:hypothetical protein BT67DRAFT_443833 [Trichocladium antarcticum]
MEMFPNAHPSTHYLVVLAPSTEHDPGALAGLMVAVTIATLMYSASAHVTTDQSHTEYILPGGFGGLASGTCGLRS